MVTYHPLLRQLIFSPAMEYEQLRHEPPLAQLGPTAIKAETLLPLVGQSAGSLTADVNVTFARPASASATIGVSICNASTVYVDYLHGAESVPVGIYDGPVRFPAPAAPKITGTIPTRADQLRLLPTDSEITVRVFVVSRHNITAIWVAFFSRWQQDCLLPGQHYPRGVLVRWPRRHVVCAALQRGGCARG